MTDLKTLVEREMQRAGEPRFVFDDLDGLRVRRRRTKQVTAAVVGLGLVAILSLVGASIYRSAPVPADPPDEAPVDLGIFEPVAGRIVYWSNGSLWAIDPNPSSPGSTQVRIGAEDQFASVTTPLGWSSDGTKLLFAREDPSDEAFQLYDHLYILDANGTETLVIPGAVEDAAISPDGSRVAFVTDGLYVVDAEGGQPVLIAPEGNSPTFSPDGTRVAYLGKERSARGVTGGREHVWVANADGTDAHEILADEPLLDEGVFELEWSPEGDRIAIGKDRDGGIYTFAPDGSDFTKVIDGGWHPFWSPDGSRIAYLEVCCSGRDGLTIADANGLNVQRVGVGDPGPWHPGAAAAPEGEETPAAMLGAGEILWLDSSNGDDLLAVNSLTGESRVLVEDVRGFSRGAISADGRWTAYERFERSSPALYVVGPDLEPRKVAQMADEGPLSAWAWSPTGAVLAVDRGTTLDVIDPSTGSVTELPSMSGVGAPPAWSPDGTTILLGASGGTIHSVNVRSGKISVLAQLPGDDLGLTMAITWSPEGARLAVYSEVAPGGEERFPPPGRLFVMDADGSDVRVLAEGVLFPGFDWSPDGSRIAFAEESTHPYSRMWIAPIDGSTASIVQTPSFEGFSSPSWGLPAWSPDGSQIAFSEEPGAAFVVDAYRPGEPEPLDDVTYASWSGGSFCWSCLWWINDPVMYSGPSET